MFLRVNASMEVNEAWTVLACVNMDGLKMTPQLVTEKAANPGCFQSV
jgi:hypothetical protein